MVNTWIGKSYAKVNLGLNVLEKLDNGYHRVKTIYTQIGIYDEVELMNSESDEIEIECSNKQIPTNETNLAYKAVELLRGKTGNKNGVKISLTKKIPAGAGLGGGSSDAATVLKGLNESWQLKLSTEELMAIGKQIGSDVAYQIEGGVKMETQGGNEAGNLEDLGQLPRCFFVLVTPELQLSSKNAYSEVDYSLVGKDGMERLAEAIRHKDLLTITEAMENDFEKWTLKKYPELNEIKRELKKEGALVSILSGKGSSVYGIYDNESRAKKTRMLMSKKYNQVWLTEPYKEIK